MRIKSIFTIASTAFAIIGLLLSTGCASKAPITPEIAIAQTEAQPKATAQANPIEREAPQIAGKDWSGYYYRTDKPGRLAITATVKQVKDELKLTTFKGKDKVHDLVGSIKPDGQVALEDKLQPMTWVSSYGAATPKSLKIVTPVGSEGSSAHQIITLRR